MDGSIATARQTPVSCAQEGRSSWAPRCWWARASSGWAGEKAQTYERWESRLTSVARHQAAAVSLWADERAADARALGSSGSLSRWANGELEGENARAWMESLRNAHQYRGLVAAGAEQTLLAGDMPPDLLEAIAALPSASKGVLTWHVRGRGEEVLVLLRHESEEIPGVVVTLVVDPATRLFQLLADSAFGTQTGDAYLVASDGANRFVFPPAASQPPRRRTSASLDGAAGRRRPGRGAGHHRPGARLGWVVLRRVTQRGVRPVRRAQQLLVMGGLLFLALASEVVAWTRAQHRATGERLEATRRELEAVRLQGRGQASEGRAARSPGCSTTPAPRSTCSTRSFQRRGHQMALEALGLDLPTLVRRTLFDLSPDLTADRVRRAARRRAAGVVSRRHQRRDDTRYPVEVITVFHQRAGARLRVGGPRHAQASGARRTCCGRSQEARGGGRLRRRGARLRRRAHADRPLGVLLLDRPAHRRRQEVEEEKAANRAAALRHQLLAFSRRRNPSSRR